MMKIQLKPQTYALSAVEWHPEKDANGQMIHGHAAYGIQSSNKPGTMSLRVDFGGHRIAHVFEGDYIVLLNGGLLEVLAPADFHAKYDVIEEAPAEEAGE